MSEKQFQLEGDAQGLDESGDLEDDPLDNDEVKLVKNAKRSLNSQKNDQDLDSKPQRELNVRKEDGQFEISTKEEREPDQIVLSTQSIIMNQKRSEQDEDHLNVRSEKDSSQRSLFQTLLPNSKTVTTKPLVPETSKVIEKDTTSSKTNSQKQKSVRNPDRQSLLAEQNLKPIQKAQGRFNESQGRPLPKGHPTNLKTDLESSFVKEKARFRQVQPTNIIDNAPKTAESTGKSSPEKKKEFFLKGTKTKIAPREISSDAKENQPVEKIGVNFVTPKYPILHLKNFDELDYLKKRLNEAETDKAVIKQELQVVETNITQIRSQIHRLLLKREANLHKTINQDNLTEVSNSGNIDLLQKIQTYKAQRERRQLLLKQKLKEREQDMRRQIEMKESQMKERLLSEKKQRIEENIFAIRHRASVRVKKNRMANQLISVLLNSSQNMNISLRHSQQLHQDLRSSHA